MDSHRSAEDPENDVHLPLDVDKRRWDEIRQREVEDPVRSRAQRDSLTTDAEREQFRWVYPGHRSPRRCIGGNKEVGAGDDGASGRSTDDPRFLRHTSQAARGCRMAVGSEQTRVGEHEDCHQGSANEEWPATAPTVDEDESEYGHKDVDYILNGGSDQVGAACEASHAEDVGDV